MSRYTSRVNFPFDAEASVTLRNAADGAETATAAEAGVDLKESGAAYWQDPSQTFEYVAVVFHVSDVDVANGDETYVLSVETAADAAFATDLVSHGSVTVTKPGAYVVTLHGPTIENTAPTASNVRVNATIGGTTPSSTYGAWMAPVVGSHR